MEYLGGVTDVLDGWCDLMGNSLKLHTEQAIVRQRHQTLTEIAEYQKLYKEWQAREDE